MAEIVRMPKLSDTMTDGVVAEWHKKIGDSVKSGDLLAEIETDKATMEFESFQDGTLLYIGVAKGEAAPVDSILAILGKKGEDVKAIIESDNAKQSNNNKEVKVEEKTEPIEETPIQETETAPTPSRVTSNKEAISSNGRIKASPLAKKLAVEKNITLSSIKGSGPDGRIIKKDIEQYTPSMITNANAITQVKYTEEPVSQMRKTIAKRLGESKFSAPHFYLTMDIDMDNAIATRKAINEISPVKISFNTLVIKATAEALNKHPKVNSSWLGDKIRYNEHINIGMAVAVDDGLLVPVLRFANSKTLVQLANEANTFAEKAKNKQLQPEDWEGNTFTISNLGMAGIESFTAIINPPDACILAIGGIKEVPVVKKGQIVPGNIMKVTLSCDHRVVDGLTGSEFLQTFKKMMENPLLYLATQSIGA